jgi:hypothetical protein
MDQSESYVRSADMAHIATFDPPTVLRLIALARTPGGLDREAVARIVDPEAWANWDVYRADWTIRPSIAKADVILALANSPPPHPEGGSE